LRSTRGEAGSRGIVQRSFDDECVINRRSTENSRLVACRKKKGARLKDETGFSQRGGNAIITYGAQFKGNDVFNYSRKKKKRRNSHIQNRRNSRLGGRRRVFPYQIKKKGSLKRGRSASSTRFGQGAKGEVGLLIKP